MMEEPLSQASQNLIKKAHSFASTLQDVDKGVESLIKVSLSQINQELVKDFQIETCRTIEILIAELQNLYLKFLKSGTYSFLRDICNKLHVLRVKYLGDIKELNSENFFKATSIYRLYSYLFRWQGSFSNKHVDSVDKALVEFLKWGIENLPKTIKNPNDAVYSKIQYLFEDAYRAYLNRSRESRYAQSVFDAIADAKQHIMDFLPAEKLIEDPKIEKIASNETTPQKTLESSYILDTRFDSMKEKSSKLENDLEKFRSELDSFKHNQKTSFEEKLSNLLAQFEDRKREIEEFYADKLSIEEPAKIWEERANKYTDKGKFWAKWLGWSCGIGFLLILLLAYYFLVPLNIENWITDFRLTFSNVRGLFMLAFALTLYVFIIRIFTRLMMSALHIARESEERHKLCLLYLALKIAGRLEKEDLATVIQSLFSRNDTGLLKENNLAMPHPVDYIAKSKE